jgi:hypothetical protein
LDVGEGVTKPATPRREQLYRSVVGASEVGVAAEALADGALVLWLLKESSASAHTSRVIR